MKVKRSRILMQILKVSICLISTALVVTFLIAGLMSPSNMTTLAGYTQMSSTYVTMNDGTKIAVRITLPPSLQRDEKIPAIIECTRYGSSYEPSFLGNALINLGIIDDSSIFVNELHLSNYAYVSFDARGSGASYGKRIVEWSEEEVHDYGEVIDWVVQQPWSNERVGTYGISYSANTAELAAVSNHPALKAVATLYGDFNPIVHLAMPGGILNETFLKEWCIMNAKTDANDMNSLFINGIQPVDQDGSGEMLEEAIEEHKNTNMYTRLKEATYFDENLIGDYKINSLAPYNYKDLIQASGVPFYIRVGWQDAGTVNGALERYLTYDNNQTLIIGPWSHGGKYLCDPYIDSTITQEELMREQTKEVITFFDKYLKENIDSIKVDDKRITYYTLGEEQWNTTESWPVEGVTYSKLYFHADGSLMINKPTDTIGKDTYAVDFTASTGDKNRWLTNLGGGEIIYPDRNDQDKKLLTYTSEVLEEDVEITGVPIVNLNISSTCPDGAFMVYLEDVAPDGKVTYITEGQIRVIHRKVTTESLEYVALDPKHSFLEKDGELLRVDEITELSIGMYATSILIKKGHRIRIAIAGQDNSVFQRIPADEVPVIEVMRDKTHASYVELPMKVKE
ncbi:CocE/NonD family hydrolase [Vallitalea okinawensis]|uniref:CocE/NonD family hydrolase n=1 Tax=Vallitalea okinawensis TaxID=2078660 RepID=UPI000CFC5DCE|nr:CocE/NonD family hydrolase [Vallitalea okinawensis]